MQKAATGALLFPLASSPRATGGSLAMSSLDLYKQDWGRGTPSLRPKQRGQPLCNPRLLREMSQESASAGFLTSWEGVFGG